MVSNTTFIFSVNIQIDGIWFWAEIRKEDIIRASFIGGCALCIGIVLHIFLYRCLKDHFNKEWIKMKAKKYEGIRIAKAEMEDHLKDEMINHFLMESDENQEINRRITLGMLFTVSVCMGGTKTQIPHPGGPRGFQNQKSPTPGPPGDSAN